MSNLMKPVSKKKGLKPGTIVFVGDKKIEKPRIRIIDYNKTDLKELEIENGNDFISYINNSNISWINIDGLHDEKLLEHIGSVFGLHPLIMEDIANTGQRPKVEISENHIFICLKMLYLDMNKKRIISEQFSFIVGQDYVLSFQERVGDVFEPVRNRLRNTIPRNRFLNSDYLAYTLIDSIVDHYYVVLEQIASQIEKLEADLIAEADDSNLQRINDLKRFLMKMRKAVWPLREVIGSLDRQETVLIKKETRPYIRDIYEHAVQVMESIETFREMVSGLLDLYMTSISNKMNAVMKVLTIIATVFIPLSFLAGVYGMNFDTTSPLNLPELKLPYGYLMFWGLVIIVGGSLFAYFKKKKWF